MGVTVVPQDNEMSAAVRDAAGDAVCDGPAASGHIDDSNALSDSSGGRSSSPSSASLENPLKLRESAMLGGAVNKGQKICCYQMCPSPMHSKKWRIVTQGTSAGGRNWEPLLGQTLCDSCYSTYRKHGTFTRSMRTNEGWIRVDGVRVREFVDATFAAKPQPRSPKISGKRPRAPGHPADASSARGQPHGMPYALQAEREQALGQTGSWEPRPCRERKPSEKMKDVMRSPLTDHIVGEASVQKRERRAKPTEHGGAQNQIHFAVYDNMPEGAFDGQMDAVGTSFECQMAEPAPAPLGSHLPSADVAVWCDVSLSSMLPEDVSEDEFMSRSTSDMSHSADQLIDGFIGSIQ